MNKTKEPTLYDVIEVIQETSKKLDSRIDSLEQSNNSRFDSIDARFGSMDTRLDSIDDRFDSIDIKIDEGFEKTNERINDVIEVMNAFAADVDKRFDETVTKDYLDCELADLRADLIMLSRKGNFKLSVLVEDLVEEGSLSRKAAKKILALEPSPQK
ncbi:MAG: hypothetical protein ABII13_05465 [Patescibacteria group bacterium]|nr:hypothetical protein [Patescibacteria group bacterium]MBU2508886.1 hypothetical protein [Patescibacteria group bacterium]